MIGTVFSFLAVLLFSSLGDFTLQSGHVIQDCRIAYRTFGTVNHDRTNVILFPTWFNGTTEDLAKYMGPSGLVDTTKYYVIAVDAFADGVSSSPSNSAAQHNRLFPRITIRDMVESEHELLVEKLHISHVYAVMGISMGGMQAFQWATAYPNYMDRLVTIVGTPRMGVADILLWSTFISSRLGTVESASEEATPDSKPSVLAQMLKVAPMAEAFLTPQVRQQLDQIFRGGNEPGHTPSQSPAGEPPAPVDLPTGKKPDDVLHQFGAMVAHDISRPYRESWSTTAATIKAKALVINSTEDKAVSPGFPQQFADMIKAQKFMMTGPCGHNAFKPDCEEAAIVPVIHRFLDEP